MRENHKTTTLLIAMAAIAATLLAAGTIAAVGSNHSALAWKHKEYQKNDKYTREDRSGSDGNNVAVNKQVVKCIIVGRDGGMTKPDGEKASLIGPPSDETGDGIGPNSCHATNINNNYDGGNGGPILGGNPGRGPM
jgi:hypothetical protein